MTNYIIKRVLVPIDFSEVASNALQTAIEICKRQLASLTIVHVIENSYLLFPPEAGAAASAILPTLIKNAEDNISNLAKELRTKHDLVINHIVQSGNPADVVCSTANLKEIDLIVMGTHGTSGWREFFLGSNAYRVIKNAPCPVMTIPGNNQWLDFKKILFPIRMVPKALQKYEYVRPIIRRNGSSLLIAGIVKQSDSSGFIEMKALVDEVKKHVFDDEVICGSEVHYTQNVARQVLDIANQGKPDLIVITATLDITLRDFFLGPYTQDIVNHSKFPVLSIRPRLSEQDQTDNPITGITIPASWSASVL